MTPSNQPAGAWFGRREPRLAENRAWCAAPPPYFVPESDFAFLALGESSTSKPKSASFFISAR